MTLTQIAMAIIENRNPEPAAASLSLKGSGSIQEDQ